MQRGTSRTIGSGLGELDVMRVTLCIQTRAKSPVLEKLKLRAERVIAPPLDSAPL
jgi:hypothetical protein